MLGRSAGSSSLPSIAAAQPLYISSASAGGLTGCRVCGMSCPKMLIQGLAQRCLMKANYCKKRFTNMSKASISDPLICPSRG